VQVQDVTTIVYVKWSRLNPINFLLKLYPNYSLTWSTRNIVHGAHAIALVAQADAKHQWRRQLWGTGARAPPQIAESNKNCLMKS
jgi:hypothetical protein